MIQKKDIKPGVRVLIRADLDAEPFEADIRLLSNIETVRLARRAGARVRLIGHRGRPGGKPSSALSLRRTAACLSRMLGENIVLVADPFSAQSFRRRDRSDAILLFENIRFWPGEEANDPEFARSLARWGDCYVNEAFASSHRSHASIAALARMLPAYAGLHLGREVEVLSRLMQKPKRPFVAVLGGAKMETKLPLIRRFLSRADSLLIGGALANTLFLLKGWEIGKSLADRENIERVPGRLLANKKLVLPRDVIVADRFSSSAGFRAVLPSGVGQGDYIVDIGPRAVKEFSSFIYGAKTVVWNGPLGYVEAREFARGTLAFSRALRHAKGYRVIGGGDTLAVLERGRLLSGYDHISTGGGAMLEFLAGEKLPGIEAL